MTPDTSMAEAVKVAVIVSIAPTLVALGALVKIFRVHKELDGRLSEWKKETEKSKMEAVVAAYDRGRKDEKIKTETKGLKS